MSIWRLDSKYPDAWVCIESRTPLERLDSDGARRSVPIETGARSMWCLVSAEGRHHTATKEPT